MIELAKEKYPKVLHKLEEWWKKKNESLYEACPYQKEDLYTICYCELEDFFEEDGIIIMTKFVRPNRWWYKIDGNGFKLTLSSGIEYETRSQARDAVVLKACEILEERICMTIKLKGSFFDKQCSHCKLYDGCTIAFVQQTYNYEKNQKAIDILSELVSNEKGCLLYLQNKELLFTDYNNNIDLF
jgi:hypothetical protein